MPLGGFAAGSRCAVQDVSRSGFEPAQPSNAESVSRCGCVIHLTYLADVELPARAKSLPNLASTPVPCCLVLSTINSSK